MRAKSKIGALFVRGVGAYILFAGAICFSVALSFFVGFNWGRTPILLNEAFKNLAENVGSLKHWVFVYRTHFNFLVLFFMALIPPLMIDAGISLVHCKRRGVWEFGIATFLLIGFQILNPSGSIQSIAYVHALIYLLLVLLIRFVFQEEAAVPQEAAGSMR